MFTVPVPQPPQAAVAGGADPAPEPNEASAKTATAPPASAPTESASRVFVRVIVSLLATALAWYGWAQFWAWRANAPKPDVPEPRPLSQAGIPRDRLSLCAQTVTLRWQTWRPGQQGLFGWVPTPDAGGSSIASTAVIGSESARIRLVTNWHVLTLQQIVNTKTADVVIQQYDMSVRFPTGKVRPVRRIGHRSGQLDLALLEIDASGLKEGEDYVVLSIPKDIRLQLGDEVVAVGSPYGLDGTQTFGHVSQFRDRAPDETLCKVIQTDAAINHGNSGGPLLARQGDRYYWVGISTWTLSGEGYPGLNFAIANTQLSGIQFVWYDATKEGTAAALRDLYQFPTGTGAK